MQRLEQTDSIDLVITGIFKGEICFFFRGFLFAFQCLCLFVFLFCLSFVSFAFLYCKENNYQSSLVHHLLVGKSFLYIAKFTLERKSITFPRKKKPTKPKTTSGWIDMSCKNRFTLLYCTFLFSVELLL